LGAAAKAAHWQRINLSWPSVLLRPSPARRNTRLAKLDAPTSPYTALILAHAGLERINLGHRTTSLISPPQIHYAVGQGALGIETRAGDEETEALVRQIGHWPTEWRTKAERACLRKLEGGCSVPVGVSSTFTPSAEAASGSSPHAGTLSLTGTVTSLDGSEHVVFTVADRPLASADDAEAAGLEVAEGLIAGGAGEILAAIAASKNAKGTVQGDEVLQQ
jgi:hydroxymethylbilane synthase